MRRATLLLALALVFPVRACAVYDPVGSGSSKLVLDSGFRSFLQRDGVRLLAGEGALRRGGAVVFQIGSGSVDPTAGRAKLELAGSLVLRNARGRVPMRQISVTTGSSPLLAKVGGSQLKVARAGRVSFRRRGFDSLLLATQLRLTPKVAMRLNKKLRPPNPFATGQVVGNLVTVARPLLTSVLPTGRAQFILDPGLVAKLDDLFVSVNPVFPAEHVGAEFTLPVVANGALAPDASSGLLRTGGEIEFLKLGGGHRFSGTSSGSTSVPRRRRPKSTPSRPPPFPASWARCRPSLKAPERPSPIPPRARSVSAASPSRSRRRRRRSSTRHSPKEAPNSRQASRWAPSRLPLGANSGAGLGASPRRRRPAAPSRSLAELLSDVSPADFALESSPAFARRFCSMPSLNSYLDPLILASEVAAQRSIKRSRIARDK